MGTTSMTRPTVLLALALLAWLPASATRAQVVEACDWRASMPALVEPWESPANTRTFANGNVRLALADLIEPAAGAFHLIILSPPYDELGGRQCAVVTQSANIGFTGLTLDGMTSAYDPAIGLTFILQAGAYNAQTGGTTPRILTLTLNQATGAITANMQGGK